MSLLEEAMQDCIFMNNSIVPDGYGGYGREWTDGVEFRAAIFLDNSIQARIAEKQGVTALYTIATNKGINLQYHDVFKRKEDGKIFRVTSDGDDVYTPESASLDMRAVSAEEWAIPTGDNNG